MSRVESVWVGSRLDVSGGWAGSCLVGLCPVVLDFVQSGRAMSGWYGSPTTDDSVIVEDLVLVDELVTVVDKRPVEVGIVALWVGATCCLVGKSADLSDTSWQSSGSGRSLQRAAGWGSPPHRKVGPIDVQIVL